MDTLVDELNNCVSLPPELRCGEYTFKLKMNPWQHPIFDHNLHHMLALLTSLYSGCGGVIYLMADDGQDVTEETFKHYKERLTSKIWEYFCLPVTMVQLSITLGTHRSWAVLLLKKVEWHSGIHAIGGHKRDSETHNS